MKKSRQIPDTLRVVMSDMIDYAGLFPPAGLDMLMFGDKAASAIHLLFSGERVKASQALPNPLLAPERKMIKGQEVSIIPVADLVRMKLSANRDKDRVHIRSLEAAGSLGRMLTASTT